MPDEFEETTRTALDKPIGNVSVMQRLSRQPVAPALPALTNTPFFSTKRLSPMIVPVVAAIVSVIAASISWESKNAAVENTRLHAVDTERAETQLQAKEPIILKVLGNRDGQLVLQNWSRTPVVDVEVSAIEVGDLAHDPRWTYGDFSAPRQTIQRLEPWDSKNLEAGFICPANLCADVSVHHSIDTGIRS